MEEVPLKFDPYRDPFRNDLAAEVYRLQQKALQESDYAVREQFQNEADNLSRELVRHLNASTQGEFRPHSVILSERDFAPFVSSLSWTEKSFVRQPMRKVLTERILEAHNAQVNDLFLLEEVNSFQRPTGQKAVLFLDETGISGGPSGKTFTPPRLALEFLQRMGLTKKAAQQLYFGLNGPSVFTNERTKNSGERKL